MRLPSDFARHQEMKSHVGEENKDAGQGHGVPVLSESLRGETASDHQCHHECGEPAEAFSRINGSGVNKDPTLEKSHFPGCIFLKWISDCRPAILLPVQRCSRVWIAWCGGSP